MAIRIFSPLNKFKYKNRFINAIINRLNHSQPTILQPELEAAFNNQINMEFFASFSYLAMAVYFGRQCVSLPGCQKYFMDQVLDEREHAHKLIDYVNRRGGGVVLQAIQPPTTQTWDCPLSAFKDALELEKSVSEKIFQLHKTAQQVGDLYACNLLENDFFDTQIEESDRLSRHVAQLEKIGNDGLGIYLFDRDLLNDNKESE